MHPARDASGSGSAHRGCEVSRRSTARPPRPTVARCDSLASSSTTARSPRLAVLAVFATGVLLRLSSHSMAARAASWSGQPRAILRTPRAATAVSASMAPEWPASQIGPWTTTRSRQGRASSQVSLVHSLHHLLVGVPGRRVAGDAADHEADERPADQAGERQHDRVAGVVDDAGQEVGQRLVVLAAAPAGGDRHEQPADADPEQRVEDELHRRALHQPDHQQHAAPTATLTISASRQLPGGQPQRP